MVCDLCGKKIAIVFLERMTRNGTKRKISLCQNCAISRGIISPVVPADQRDIESVFNEIEKKRADDSIESKMLCPTCGKSLYEIKQTGLAGCPNCYEVFKDAIKSAMSSHGLQGKYTGSMPERVQGFRNSLTDRADLQTKLDEAIKQENYEKAAVYRDYLRALETGAVSDGEAK